MLSLLVRSFEAHVTTIAVLPVLLGQDQSLQAILCPISWGQVQLM